MKRWTVIQLHRGLGEHAAAWDELLHRLFNANPMLESRFVDAMLLHFGDGTERLCIWHASGLPQAMCVLKPQGMGIWASFLPAQAQIGPVLLNRPDTVTRLFRKLPGIIGQIDFLANDPYFGDLTQTNPSIVTSQDHALTMCIQLTGSFESYWSSRSRKLVQNIGRYRRRLAADSVPSRFVVITNHSDVNDAVTRYAALETKGWKGRAGTALTVDNAQGAFYRDVARRFAQSGQLGVHELWLGDQLAASRIAIVVADTVVMLKTTYDESLDKYAPGRLLLLSVIEHSFATHPGGVVEFYTNANIDQLAWATGHRWIRHVSFYRSFFISRFRLIAKAGRRIASPRISAASRKDQTDTVCAFRHPDELPADARRLFDIAEKEGVEFGIDWYRNLVNSVFPGDEGVRIHVLRRNGIAVAALPILATKMALWRNVESLSNYYSAIYGPLVSPGVAARDLVPLINAVRDAHPSLRSMRFAPMDPQSTSYHMLLDALKMAGMVPFEFFCFGNWFLKVGGAWADYLKGRSGTLRSTIKRMGKKFSADGGTMVLVQGGSELERALAAYERVYAASWKKKEPFPAFVPGLARACAARGSLRLGVAWLKDEPIAAQLWIVAGGKASIYKLAYNENYKAYAPGTLLTTMLMQHVIEKDLVAEVDYLIGDDPYKQSWMSDRRERWGIVAFNRRTIAGLLGLGQEAVGRAFKLLMSRVKAATVATP